MLGIGKKQNTAFQGGNSITLISKETEVLGDIRFVGALEIQGVVKGNVFAKEEGATAIVRVIDGGRVEGEVHAPKVIINGDVHGDVHCSDHVELAAKAIVRGDVHYNLIEMVKGAQINGKLVYAGAKVKPVVIDKAPLKPQTTVD